MNTITSVVPGLYRLSRKPGCGLPPCVGHEPVWPRLRHVAAAAALAGCTLPVWAADRETSPGEFEAAVPGEAQSEAAPNWRNILIDTGRDVSRRHSPFGGLREARRSGLLDNPAQRGLYIPLAPSWRAAFDTTVSPAQLAPGQHQYTIGTQIQKLLPGDWIAGVGFHRSEYVRLESQTRTFSLERYWGNFGAGYTLFSVKPDASGASAPAHRFQFSYQYSNLGSIGLAYSTGRDFEAIPGNGPFTTDVRNWTLSGRHWFARDWAVTYEALTERYGNLSRRDGLRLGLRYRF